MATRKRSGPGDTELHPALTVPLATLERDLLMRIELGRALTTDIATEDALKEHQATYATWNEYNATLIRRSFSTSGPVDDYLQRPSVWAASSVTPPLQVRIDVFKSEVETKLRRLESLKGRLALYVPPTSDLAEESAPAAKRAEPESIFIVHGHDNATKQEVARFLQQVTTLKPVILHEEPNQGRTLIEKFEAHAADVAFAVVLLTGDDEGGVRGKSDTKPRARQNVVLELGFFIGALHRDRVAVLYEEGVEATVGPARGRLATAPRRVGLEVETCEGATSCRHRR